MKYCPYEALRFPDDVSNCRVCGRPLVDAAMMADLPDEVTTRLANSSCPNPACAALVAPSRTSFCAVCGSRLEPISFELWLAKFVNPAMEKDPAGVLVSPAGLFRPVATLGLSSREARSRLDLFLEQRIGVSRDVLDTWLEETSTALADPEKQEAELQTALQRARTLRIEPKLATAVVAALAQTTEVDNGSREAPAGLQSLLRKNVVVADLQNVTAADQAAQMSKRSEFAAVREDKPPSRSERKSGSGKRELRRRGSGDADGKAGGAGSTLLETEARKQPASVAQDADQRPEHHPVGRLLLGSALALVLLAGALLILKRSLGPAPNINSPEVPRATPTPSRMVSLTGGTFLMGRDDRDEYERPAHSVTVDPFEMDVREVSNREYAEFVQAKGHRPPSTWTNGAYPPGTASNPVTGVDWYDANAYARWAGKRLPTEEEWEFAARSGDARKYPWGDEWRANAANAAESTAHHLVAVASYPLGSSAAGVQDLIGNAWEWTASDLKPYPGGTFSSRPQGVFKIIRGGSWQEDAKQATSTYRGYLPVSGAKDYSATGFRCVQAAGAAVESPAKD